jgi:esterase/lipase superfamily enzyme
MPTTVYFATNRVVTNASDPINGYSASMVPPSAPNQMTYGTAFVSGVNVATDAAGTITQITNINQGAFSQAVIGDLSRPGRNLLVFIHGFDNTFSDAITRAAFNREWLAAADQPGASTTVVAFSWPSLGKAVSFPVAQEDYRADQTMAQNSGIHLMAFLANLSPILASARAGGQRATLLAHSMGNLALVSGVENWFLHGNGNDVMLDLAILAAADCRYDTFDQPFPGGLSGLVRLTQRVSVYYSQSDQILKLSMVINLGAKRLGQDGPHNMADTSEFPTNVYTMVNCSAYQDYDFNVMSSHQYYRMSPTVRSIMVNDMAAQVVA